jgi:hypothetical protein
MAMIAIQLPEKHLTQAAALALEQHLSRQIKPVVGEDPKAQSTHQQPPPKTNCYQPLLIDL